MLMASRTSPHVRAKTPCICNVSDIEIRMACQDTTWECITAGWTCGNASCRRKKCHEEMCRTCGWVIGGLVRTMGEFHISPNDKWVDIAGAWYQIFAFAGAVVLLPCT